MYRAQLHGQEDLEETLNRFREKQDLRIKEMQKRGEENELRPACILATSHEIMSRYSDQLMSFTTSTVIWSSLLVFFHGVIEICRCCMLKRLDCRTQYMLAIIRAFALSAQPSSTV